MNHRIVKTDPLKHLGFRAKYVEGERCRIVGYETADNTDRVEWLRIAIEREGRTHVLNVRPDVVNL